MRWCCSAHNWILFYCQWLRREMEKDSGAISQMEQHDTWLRHAANAGENIRGLRNEVLAAVAAIMPTCKAWVLTSKGHKKEEFGKMTNAEPKEEETDQIYIIIFKRRKSFNNKQQAKKQSSKLHKDHPGWGGLPCLSKSQLRPETGGLQGRWSPAPRLWHSCSLRISAAQAGFRQSGRP